MNKPAICGVITKNNGGLITRANQMVDLFELRIDLVGDSWPDIVKLIGKPWIATCRSISEGGGWNKSEEKRKETLIKATQGGATMVDLELTTPDIDRFVPIIKHEARLIISYHNFDQTPSFSELSQLVTSQFDKGADIAKIATQANSINDNINLLNLVQVFRQREVVITGMGERGIVSRVLSPLAGGAFTFASLEKGLESAEGQITAAEMKNLYSLLEL